MTARPSLARALAIAAALLAPSALACTVTVLTDGDRVMFCNNEDWIDPRARLWFVPAPSADGHGCVYVGFVDGWAQGGMNTAGLAFDGVAGYRETWEHDGEQPVAPPRSAERMLESCVNVDQAIAYYERHWEPALALAKFVVADRSGASAIIGAREGKLHVVRAARSTSLGYHAARALQMLGDHPAATLAQALAVLHATQRTGKYGTKYGNIFDLKAGTVWFQRCDPGTEAAEFNLAVELRKGAHQFDLPCVTDGHPASSDTPNAAPATAR